MLQTNTKGIENALARDERWTRILGMMSASDAPASIIQELYRRIQGILHVWVCDGYSFRDTFSPYSNRQYSGSLITFRASALSATAYSPPE